MTTLLPLAPEYYGAVAQWLSTPDINRWLSSDWREKETTATIMAIAARNRKNRFYLVTHCNEPCGLVALSDVELGDKTAMAWYLLGKRELQGNGITSEAVRQLVTIAFSEMHLQSIYAWAMEANEASLRLLRKVGFREAGRIRRSVCLAGKQLDRIYFDLTPDDSNVGL